MTTHTLESPASDGTGRPPAVVRALRAFRHWRKARPFPSGLLIILSGLEIWAAPYSSIGVMIHEGIAGFSAVFVGTLLIVFGLTVWFATAYRAFAGIAAILLGLIALPTINIGGFIIGTLLALIGGGLAVAWTPRPGWEAPTRRERRREHGAEQGEQAEFGEAESGSYQAGSYEAGMYENAADPAAMQEHGTAITNEAELAEFEARSRAGADAPTINLPEVEERGADQHPEA